MHSSNLCTEITLNTSQDEIAVCNLGSINLVQHVQGGVLDREKLARTIKTAVSYARQRDRHQLLRCTTSTQFKLESIVL